MANRNPETYNFGLDAELAAKQVREMRLRFSIPRVRVDEKHTTLLIPSLLSQAAKWNPQDAATALAWVSKLSGMTLPSDFHEALKDGVALCKVCCGLGASRLLRH